MPTVPRDDDIPTTPQSQILTKHTYNPKLVNPMQGSHEIPREQETLIYPSTSIGGSKISKHTSSPQEIRNTEPSETLIVPQISLKDALEAVPYFDGRPGQFRSFTNGCNDAKAMVSPRMEQNLVRLIKNRLKGIAKDTVEGTHFDNVKDFIEYLEIYFAPRHSISRLQGQLSRSVQRFNEDVLTYGTRIKQLRNLINETHQRTYPNLSYYAEDTEREAIECFSLGLKRGIHINANQFRTLEDAIRGAIGAEADKARYDELHRSFPMERSTTRWSRFQNNDPNDETSRPYDDQRRVNKVQFNLTERHCKICDKSGHTEDYCWTKRQDGTARRRPIECNYCKKIGHTIDICRKKKYDEQTRQNQGNDYNLPTSSATREEAKKTLRINLLTKEDTMHECAYSTTQK